MILGKTIKLKWSSPIHIYYISKGYKFTKFFDEFEVKVEDLHPGCKKQIKCKCDFCGKEFTRGYCCIYGNVSKTQTCGSKNCKNLARQKACYDKYGTDFYFQTDEFKQKSKQTCKNKYDCKYTGQISTAKEKKKQTCLLRYSVDNPSKNESIKQKIKNTNYERYDGPAPICNKIIEQKARIKRAITMYKNKTQKCSKNQLKIAKLVNGKINYPFLTYSLDIALPIEKIYIEYDGFKH